MAIHLIPADLVASQAQAVLDDIGADAIKIGMLGEAAQALSRVLVDWPGIPLVIDPVMVAKDGTVLADTGAIDALKALFLPRSALLTPNAPEAAALTGRAVETTDDLRRAGEALLTAGCRAVLMKGGHVPGDTVVDVLMSGAGETTFEGPRIVSRHTHGTGCTLASACAVGLAQGLGLETAVARAWGYTAEAIRRAPGLGGGAGPLDHGWPLRRG
jgi:hydroxymethylpyrimidine/phosphomethylpyrimidine kinase